MKTELEVYLEQDLAPRADNFNILTWWKDNQVDYPILSKLARDILSIQVSTVASESEFSAGGRVVDPFRTRLDSKTVQALICSKDWIAASKGGEIKSVLKDMDVESMEQRFATMVHMLEYQEDDDSAVDLEDFLNDEVDE
uniref:Uncharacterized protein n=1 Tax=Avena sativa TaxID=4498 RepID=A0ACD5VXP9_AVESA